MDHMTRLWCTGSAGATARSDPGWPASACPAKAGFCRPLPGSAFAPVRPCVQRPGARRPGAAVRPARWRCSASSPTTMTQAQTGGIPMTAVRPDLDLPPASGSAPRPGTAWRLPTPPAAGFAPACRCPVSPGCCSAWRSSWCWRRAPAWAADAQAMAEAASAPRAMSPAAAPRTVTVFVREGCPHCADAKAMAGAAGARSGPTCSSCCGPSTAMRRHGRNCRSCRAPPASGRRVCRPSWSMAGCWWASTMPNMPGASCWP